EATAELLDVLALGAPVFLAEAEVPVALNGALPLAPAQHVASGQLLESLEDRMWRRDVLECQIAREALSIEAARARRVLEERLELGPEEQRVADLRIVERLLAEPVAREEKLAPRLLPQPQPQHPLYPPHPLPP